MSCYTSFKRLLVNGVLIEMELGHELELAHTAVEHHIVNLGSPLMLSFACGATFAKHSLGLAFGATVIVMVEPALLGTSSFKPTLVVEPLAPALNLTETLFAKEVRHVLGNENHSASSDACSSGVEGAASIKTISSKCNTRKPTHALEVITSMTDVNAFEGHHGEKLCVAKKRSKPRSLQMCPIVENAFGIDFIARRASSGEAMWRQCAASFSTMMRHFQKSPSCFKWEADSERRTIITKAIC
jgi:hypothetical protein